MFVYLSDINYHQLSHKWLLVPSRNKFTVVKRRYCDKVIALQAELVKPKMVNEPPQV